MEPVPSGLSVLPDGVGARRPPPQGPKCRPGARLAYGKVSRHRLIPVIESACIPVIEPGCGEGLQRVEPPARAAAAACGIGQKQPRCPRLRRVPSRPGLPAPATALREAREPRCAQGHTWSAQRTHAVSAGSGEHGGDGGRGAKRPARPGPTGLTPGIAEAWRPGSPGPAGAPCLPPSGAAERNTRVERRERCPLGRSAGSRHSRPGPRALRTHRQASMGVTGPRAGAPRLPCSRPDRTSVRHHKAGWRVKAGPRPGVPPRV
jgi:hypothetical protein